MKKTNTIHVEASIIGTLLCAPEYFATANKTLKPEMFRYYKDMYDWMQDLDVNKMMSWDIQMAASKFGDISDLIVASEPETCSAAINFLKEEYDRQNDQAMYISAARQLEVDSPYLVREYILSHVGENNEIEAEKTRGDKMYEAWQDIETGQIGVPPCWTSITSRAGYRKAKLGLLRELLEQGKLKRHCGCCLS